MNLKTDKYDHSVTVNGNTQISLMDGGIARIIYHARSVGDIIHPFSVEGYEMLTADFMDRMETLRSLIPLQTPILLEIVGCKLSEKERQAIDNAIRVHYRIKLAGSRRKLKASQKKLAVFMPCFLLSVIFLMTAQHVKNDVLTQYLYLPFWFFGYRILTYPIFDHRPLRREMERLRQFASMCISVPERSDRPLTQTDRKKITREYEDLCRRAIETTDKDRVKEYVLLDAGIVSFECTVSCMDDLLDPAFGEGDELLSPALREYLSQAEALTDPGERVQLTVDGFAVTESEAGSVRRAVLHTYTLRTLDCMNDIRSNNRNTVQFGLCLVIASLLLTLWGSASGPALHEALLVIFWFFGDYFFEFILVSKRQLSKQKRRQMSFADMTVNFRQIKKDD